MGLSPRDSYVEQPALFIVLLGQTRIQYICLPVVVDVRHIVCILTVQFALSKADWVSILDCVPTTTCRRERVGVHIREDDDRIFEPFRRMYRLHRDRVCSSTALDFVGAAISNRLFNELDHLSASERGRSIDGLDGFKHDVGGRTSLIVLLEHSAGDAPKRC
jgi:hypothetical protein